MPNMGDAMLHYPGALSKLSQWFALSTVNGGWWWLIAVSLQELSTAEGTDQIYASFHGQEWARVYISCLNLGQLCWMISGPEHPQDWLRLCWKYIHCSLTSFQVFIPTVFPSNLLHTNLYLRVCVWGNWPASYNSVLFLCRTDTLLKWGTGFD